MINHETVTEFCGSVLASLDGNQDRIVGGCVGFEHLLAGSRTSHMHSFISFSSTAPQVARMHGVSSSQQ